MFQSFVTLGGDKVTGVDCVKGIGMWGAVRGMSCLSLFPSEYRKLPKALWLLPTPSVTRPRHCWGFL